MSDSPVSQAPIQANSFQEYLLQKGIIDDAAYKKVLDYLASKPDASANPGDFLVAEKIVDEEKIAIAKGEYFGFPYVNLREGKVPQEVLAVIPQEAVGFYRFAPFEVDGSILKVAIMDPTNLQALQALEFLGQKQGLHISLFVASAESINSALGQSQVMSNVVDKALQEFQRVEQSETKPGAKQGAIPVQVLESAPIVKIVDVILSNAIEANASDIHIEPSESEVRVRYRIDGILHNSLVVPRHVHAAIVSRIKILSNLKIDESRLPQDGRFHFATGKRSVDLRVSVLPLIYGEKVVMRILDKSTQVPTLEQLGIRGIFLEWVKENIHKSHGIFLITGPTGSGKSTTLYAILSMLNTAEVNIVTMEDPVEYFIPGVNQSQVNPDIGLTFASGLRSILRQDPNVVMVGEVRDRETAELAVHAALTGHLVFSTLHTNSAVGAIPRLVDMEIEEFLLAASMNMVIAQRLVRKICDKCKVPTDLPPEVVEDFKNELLLIQPKILQSLNLDPAGHIQAYKGEGCDACERTGYKGRVGIFEVFNISPAIQELIVSHQPQSAVIKQAESEGMISMRQDGIMKVITGETSYEEVVRVTSE